MVWSVGGVVHVAVPIVVVLPSSGMLVLSPPGRTNAKLLEPFDEIHFALFAPFAWTVIVVGCDVGLG